MKFSVGTPSGPFDEFAATPVQPTRLDALTPGLVEGFSTPGPDNSTPGPVAASTPVVAVALQFEQAPEPCLRVFLSAT